MDSYWADAVHMRSDCDHLWSSSDVMRKNFSSSWATPCAKFEDHLREISRAYVIIVSQQPIRKNLQIWSLTFVDFTSLCYSSSIPRSDFSYILPKKFPGDGPWANPPIIYFCSISIFWQKMFTKSALFYCRCFLPPILLLRFTYRFL